MGARPLNAKNTRKLGEIAGLHFNRALGFGDPCIFEGRTDDDRHFEVNRRTGEVGEITDRHWSSCPEGAKLEAARKMQI